MAPTLLAARLVLGCVFLISAAGKLRSSAALADGIMEYRLLSQFQARMLARLLPPLELALGVLLLSGLLVSSAATISLLLLLVFTAAIIVNLRRGRKFPCRCFGTDRSEIGVLTVLRNALLMGVAAVLTVGNASASGAWGATESWRAVSNAGDAVEVALVAGAFLLAFFLLDQLDLPLLTRGAGRYSKGAAPALWERASYHDKKASGG